jgi:hypothetical protein
MLAAGQPADMDAIHAATGTTVQAWRPPSTGNWPRNQIRPHLGHRRLCAEVHPHVLHDKDVVELHFA